MPTVYPRWDKEWWARFALPTLRISQGHTFSFPRHDLPGFCVIAHPQTGEGAGNAGCWPHPRGPACKRKCIFAHASNDRFSRINRHSPRNGATAYTWSPRCAGLSGHRRPRERLARSLIPASGDRDNTTSPSVSTRSSGAPTRPSHPASHARDDRETPLWRRRDEREKTIVFRKTEEEYFCGEGLTHFR